MAALTAHTLARELLSLPDKPVQIEARMHFRLDVTVPAGDWVSAPDECRSKPAADVRHEGAYILIRGE